MINIHTQTGAVEKSIRNRIQIRTTLGNKRKTNLFRVEKKKKMAK